MNSPLMTPTFETATRFTQAREGRQFGVAAKALARLMLTGSDAQLTKGLKPNNKIQIANAFAGNPNCLFSRA